MPDITRTVLVVDDDAAVRKSLKFALELEGFAVRLYPGVEEVLADSELPARGCLVVDYRMPVMSGVDLVGSLRRRNVDLPAILITTKVSEELCQRAAEAGIRQVLEKPFEGNSLVHSIRNAFAASP